MEYDGTFWQVLPVWPYPEMSPFATYSPSVERLGVYRSTSAAQTLINPKGGVIHSGKKYSVTKKKLTTDRTLQQTDNGSIGAETWQIARR